MVCRGYKKVWNADLNDSLETEVFFSSPITTFLLLTKPTILAADKASFQNFYLIYQLLSFSFNFNFANFFIQYILVEVFNLVFLVYNLMKFDLYYRNVDCEKEFGFILILL